MQSIIYEMEYDVAINDYTLSVLLTFLSGLSMNKFTHKTPYTTLRTFADLLSTLSLV